MSKHIETLWTHQGMTGYILLRASVKCLIIVSLVSDQCIYVRTYRSVEIQQFVLLVSGMNDELDWSLIVGAAAEWHITNN
jgi:hypothetical protein